MLAARRFISGVLRFAAAISCVTFSSARAEPAADATLALTAFEARAGVTADDAALVADLVTATLVNDGKLRIVERAQLAKVMKEQALAASGAMSDQAQIKVAQLVGAHWIFVGSLQGHKKGYALSGRAIDSSSGQVAFADSVPIESKDLLSAGARQLAHKLQDALVGGKKTASTNLDDYDVPQLKEAARQLAQAIAARFPKIEGHLVEVLPNNSASCHFADPKSAFNGERFAVSGHDSVTEQMAEKGYYLVTEVSERGCNGRLRPSGHDEISNGDLIRSLPLKVSMKPLEVGAGTDPQVSEILSKECAESLKNQPGFELADAPQIALVGRIGGARGHRVIEVQALDAKSRTVLQRWDLTGSF